MKSWIASAFAGLVLLGAAPALAQAPKDLGVAVGITAPAISATTQGGKPVTFADIRGEKGLVIAFVRSADWCPFCKQQLKDLNTIAGQLETRGFRLAALSYDSVETLAKFAKSGKISYTLLSDPQSKVIDAFGIRNMDVAGNRRMDGIPHPAIYIIGADGMILGKLHEENYRKRPPTDVVLQAVDSALMKQLPKS